MEILEATESLRLLGRCGIGRVGLSVGALPAIFPVNYAVHEGAIYFLASDGAKLSAASQNAVIAFEVDQADAMSHTGWSVLVVGRASAVDRAKHPELDRIRLVRWAGKGEADLIRIDPAIVTGRRITQVAQALHSS